MRFPRVFVIDAVSQIVSESIVKAWNENNPDVIKKSFEKIFFRAQSLQVGVEKENRVLAKESTLLSNPGSMGV
ncbi:hypothetical protein TNCV_4079521 [Trichonephila clavipes]|nr:hypothetical protein TNCV_4079521 [Trichonephila clavipes]